MIFLENQQKLRKKPKSRINKSKLTIFQKLTAFEANKQRFL